MTLIESDDSWLLWEPLARTPVNGPLSDCEDPPDRADDAVVRSAYANGPRFVSELDEGADDETLSSRLISRLVPAVN